MAESPIEVVTGEERMGSGVGVDTAGAASVVVAAAATTGGAATVAALAVALAARTSDSMIVLPANTASISLITVFISPDNFSACSINSFVVEGNDMTVLEGDVDQELAVAATAMVAGDVVIVAAAAAAVVVVVVAIGAVLAIRSATVAGSASASAVAGWSATTLTLVRVSGGCPLMGVIKTSVGALLTKEYLSPCHDFVIPSSLNKAR
mmetsp:Transcript_795/g.1253  ORF Transcript_795/g.1253 Transcript_795/m.1253 type:complete len:208 (-) Transcript_795:546-1169(-)